MDNGQNYGGKGRALLDNLPDGLVTADDVADRAPGLPPAVPSGPGSLPPGSLSSGLVSSGSVSSGSVAAGLPPSESPSRESLPPDLLPVALWPADRLRAALTGATGAELARVVAEATDPAAGLLADLPEDALGDLVIACARLQSWAAGLQARTMGERASRETSPLAHSSLVAQVTGELAVTGAEASEVVVRGESGADHPTVITALTRGRIDVKKAHTLLRSASQLTVEERAEAIARYLPQAPYRTWRWLQSKLLAFAKSRHGADRAAKAAAERRSVQVDRADNDMAWLSAYLPAVDAAAVWGVVDDMAHQLRRTPGEERDFGQLRADCLTGIVTGRLRTAGQAGSGGWPDGDAPGRRARGGDVTGADVTSSEGTGPDGTGPDGPSPDGTGRNADAGDGADSQAPPSHVCACGGRVPVRQTVVRVVPTRPVVRVTVPASALLGVDDAPGELDGFGPITAELAGRIATDATWQRLVTDPVTGVLTDYSTTSYRPGKVLRQAVVARDRTCSFPHCEHPADRDDLDHIAPFDHDLDTAGVPPGTPGQTRADNLQALCRRHHLLKTHGGWSVVRDRASGITTWTAPTGRVHVRPPTVLDTRVGIGEIAATGAVDVDTSYDLTLRSLAGRRPPRADPPRKAGAAPADRETGEVVPRLQELAAPPF